MALSHSQTRRHVIKLFLVCLKFLLLLEITCQTRYYFWCTEQILGPSLHYLEKFPSWAGLLLIFNTYFIGKLCLMCYLEATFQHQNIEVHCRYETHVWYVCVGIHLITPSTWFPVCIKNDVVLLVLYFYLYLPDSCSFFWWLFSNTYLDFVCCLICWTDPFLSFMRTKNLQKGSWLTDSQS